MKVKPTAKYNDPINEEDLYGFHIHKIYDEFENDFYDNDVEFRTKIAPIKFTEKIPLVLYELLTDSEKILYHQFLIDYAAEKESESKT